MANLFIIMGVSGSGKSTVAKQLAEQLKYSYIDADDFHTQEAKSAMAQGEALTHELRSQWMERLQRFLVTKAKKKIPIVLAHSGLKQVHRDMLRVLGFRTQFFFLDGNESLITARMQKRSEHFFPVTLLRSQFQAFEHPRLSQEIGEELDISTINIDQDTASILAKINQIITEVISNESVI